MGRAKLAIKYQENLRARRTTYKIRLKGLKKKTSELSLLCGVDVLLASFSPEQNTLEFWPEDTVEFERIRERYFRFKSEKSDCNCGGDHEAKGKITEHQIPCLPKPSPSFSLWSVHEEKAAMEIKLKEVRERLDFLQGQRQEEEERIQAQYNVSMASQQLQDHHPYEQPSHFSQSLPPHEQLLLVSPPLPPHGQLLPVSLPLPPPEQASALPKSIPRHLDADFNIEDPPTSLQPFDSPLWGNYDYISWCDSLLDYEAEL